MVLFHLLPYAHERIRRVSWKLVHPYTPTPHVSEFIFRCIPPLDQSRKLTTAKGIYYTMNIDVDIKNNNVIYDLRSINLN